MRFHKTRKVNRATYTYEVYNADGIRQPSIVICPVEDGVTEEDIKLLHALDDSEVYYNLKASKPVQDKETKTIITEWQQKYIENFKKKHGYEPHPKDVEEAVKETFPKQWTQSLEGLMEGLDNTNKTAIATLSITDEESGPIERMHEIIEKLPPREQYVYWKVLVGGEKKKDVAAELGISDVRVSQIAKKIQKLFAEDKILKSFFR